MNSSPAPHSSVPALSTLKATYPELRALFFDMDGTLFNTEPYHVDALMQMGAKYRIESPHDPHALKEMMIGMADHLVFEIIKNWKGVPSHWKSASDFVNEKNQNLAEIFKNVDPRDFFLAETLNLLIEAKISGLTLALITSSEKLITEELLKITRVRSFFDFVLTRDDCPKHKPDPWPYVKAMEMGGLKKSEVVIFEDSKVGLEAAIASGAHVIKVGWY